MEGERTRLWEKTNFEVQFRRKHGFVNVRRMMGTSGYPQIVSKLKVNNNNKHFGDAILYSSRTFHVKNTLLRNLTIIMGLVLADSRR